MSTGMVRMALEVEELELVNFFSLNGLAAIAMYLMAYLFRIIERR